MTKITYAVLFSALCVSSGAAADAQAARPKVYNDIVACRGIADGAARLQCFDSATKALENATENRQIVMLDQGEVRKTQRSLFGFALPKIPFFGESNEEQDDEFKQVEGALAGVQALGNGKYQFTVNDAGTWQTTETSWSVLKNGQKFKIKRGAVGSYMLVINNSGVRVKRVN